MENRWNQGIRRLSQFPTASFAVWILLWGANFVTPRYDSRHTVRRSSTRHNSASDLGLSGLSAANVTEVSQDFKQVTSREGSYCEMVSRKALRGQEIVINIHDLSNSPADAYFCSFIDHDTSAKIICTNLSILTSS